MGTSHSVVRNIPKYGIYGKIILPTKLWIKDTVPEKVLN